MHRSDISKIKIIQSEVTGGPVLKIETKNNEQYRFYINDLDITRFLISVKIASQKYLVDKKMYNSWANYLIVSTEDFGE